MDSTLINQVKPGILDSLWQIFPFESLSHVHIHCLTLPSSKTDASYGLIFPCCKVDFRENVKTQIILIYCTDFSHYICLTNVTNNAETIVQFNFYLNVKKTSFITTPHCKFPFQRFVIEMRL